MGVDATHKADIVKQAAASLGFERCGIARARSIGRSDYLTAWLGAGRAGSMGYLHRNLKPRLNPAALLEGARSVVVVALIYRQNAPEPPKGVNPQGRVAMYAWGEDYHEVIRDKLHRMVAMLRERIDEPFEARPCVDTAPIVERELAAAAGVGWIGKNTMVLHQDLGSYFFLGAVVTTLELAPDEPVADHCGSCTACLDACPTQAFPSPYEMDASRCISYLTIEHRGDISRPFQDMMGDWVFGCDVCQEVCPFNRHAPTTREARLESKPPAPRADLQTLLSWSQEDYREALKDRALNRATLPMLQRNARIALTNLQNLRSDVASPLVGGA